MLLALILTWLKFAIGGVALILLVSAIVFIWAVVIAKWIHADEGDGWDTDIGGYDQW